MVNRVTPRAQIYTLDEHPKITKMLQEALQDLIDDDGFSRKKYRPKKLFEIKASNAIAISEEVINSAFHLDVKNVYESIVNRFKYKRLAEQRNQLDPLGGFRITLASVSNGNWRTLNNQRLPWKHEKVWWWIDLAQSFAAHE